MKLQSFDMALTHPYCKYVSEIIDPHDVDKMYHDNHYGVRIEDDDELFCRLVMEINQAGLSWKTILKKENGFRKAYHNFSVKKVARYGAKDFSRLMNDSQIIRNNLKIGASIYNAQMILALQKEYGSFRKWLDVQGKILKTNKEKWVRLFKQHFKFVGGEIVGEFLMSIDMLPGSHDKKCRLYKHKQPVHSNTFI